MYRTSYNPYRQSRPAWSVSQDRAGLDFESARWTSFAEANPDIASWLEAKADSFDFAASLAAFVMRKGDLTPGQKSAAVRCAEKDALRATHRDAAPHLTVNTSAAREVLASKKKYMVAGFTFSLGGPYSANPGAVYVKDNGEYVGKVPSGSNIFQPGRGFDASRFAALKLAMENPGEAVRADAAERARLLAEAIAEGRTLSMPCGCCGRTLTDPVSIERGIGPICAGQWGF